MIKRIKILVIFIIPFLISGCWDMRELNEMALVMAVGVDRNTDTGKFIVTVQVARPSANAGNQGTATGEPVWTVSAEGDTIFEAIRNIAKFTSRRVMWAHNNVIIIGEEVAREDITPILDFFTHNKELRMISWVAISKGLARDYIGTKTGIENVPGTSLENLFRYSQLPAESIKSDMLQVFCSFLNTEEELLVAGVDMKNRLVSAGQSQEQGNKEQVELSGSAVFKGSKMVGWVSPEATRGLNWVDNQVTDAVVVVTFPDKNKQKVSVEIKSSDVKIKSYIMNEIPNIKIEVKGTCLIAEEDFSSSIGIEQFKSAVEDALNKQIEKDINEGIQIVQKVYESDVLGFGRIVHIENKDIWNKSLSSRWPEIYPKVPVEVNVEMDIISSYLYQEPLNVEKVDVDHE